MNNAYLLRSQKITRAIIIAFVSIYLVTVIERIFKTVNKDKAPTELLIEHALEKAQMQSKIDALNNKIHDYEIDILKIRIDVSNLSNDQIDSTWTAIFD